MQVSGKWTQSKGVGEEEGGGTGEWAVIDDPSSDGVYID